MNGVDPTGYASAIMVVIGMILAGLAIIAAICL